MIDKKYCATRETVTEVLEGLAEEYARQNPTVIVALETDGSTDPTNIRGIIVFRDPVTRVIPMFLTPHLVRIDGEAVFVGHKDGPALLRDKIVREIDSTTVPEG